MDILQFINTYLSGILSVLVSAITAVITLIYVIFTYKQMKASQKSVEQTSEQMKINNQPCVVADISQTHGSACFTESGRRQLHIELEIENIGDSPALEIYALSHMELQHTKNVTDGSNIVDMDYYPDYLRYVKSNERQTISVRYETDEINMLVEDLRYRHEKNVQRIHTNPYKHPYHGTVLVVEIYYKNLLGQWFKNTLRQQISWLVDKNASPRKTNNLNENTIPPCLLGRETEFTLQLVSPKFSPTGIELVSIKEIQEKLAPYQDELSFSAIMSQK